MPEYTYCCKFCDCQFDLIQSIKANRKKKCPECGKAGLERILYAAKGHVKLSANEMKSVGDLAKFNTDKLTTTEKQAKDHEYAEGSKLAKHNLKKQTDEKPWWHSGPDKTSQSEIQKMTAAQKKKYIKDGSK